MRLYLDLLQIWTGYDKILDNIATVGKQFKWLLNVHKSDQFKGKMSFILGLSCLCYLVDTLS